MRDSADEPATDLALTENHHAQMWLMLGLTDRALAVMRVDDSGVETRFRARRLALRLRAARLSGHDTSALEAAAATLLPGIESAFHRSLLELETLHSAAPHEAAAGFERLHAEPAVIERPGLRLHAAVRAAAARLACGDTACAVEWIEAAKPAMAAMATIPPFDMSCEEPWLIARDVFAASGDEIAATNAQQRAEEIVTSRRERLPADWLAT